MRKRLNYLFVLALISFSTFGQFNPQNNEITKKYFPDPELEIKTPAFSKKGFTNYDDMMSFLNSIIEKHPDIVTLSFIGESQKKKKIPMLVLNRNNGQEKIKVWFQGGLHGDEPASTESMLYLFDKILNDPTYSYLLDKITLAIMPMANIDGYEKQDRYAANGLDLNRDQVKLLAPESNYLKQAFTNFGAEVAIDFHEYRPFRKEFFELGTHGISSIYDAMFMVSGNLNLSINLRDYNQNILIGNAMKVLNDSNLKSRYYIAANKKHNEIYFNQCTTEARSSTTSYALTNCISALIEIRGVNLQKTSFKRRINTTFLIASSFLKTAYDDLNTIKEVLKKSNETFHENLAVTCKKPQEIQTIQVIDLKDNQEIALEVKVNNALKAKPVLERPRPQAYLILPEQTKLIEKLKILGLEVDELENDKNLQVENYTVISKTISPDEEEGFKEQEVETTVQKIQKNFPKGTFIVYLNQKNAKMATEVLEPESENGFVKFHVYETKLNNELPIYRYLNNEKI